MFFKPLGVFLLLILVFNQLFCSRMFLYIFACLFCYICVNFPAARHSSSLTNPLAHLNLPHLSAASTTAHSNIVPEFKLAYRLNVYLVFLHSPLQLCFESINIICPHIVVWCSSQVLLQSLKKKPNIELS